MGLLFGKPSNIELLPTLGQFSTHDGTLKYVKFELLVIFIFWAKVLFSANDLFVYKSLDFQIQSGFLAPLPDCSFLRSFRAIRMSAG